MDWSEIDPQDTNVIMHMYRGEIQRLNTWRQRMDRTSNWTMVITVGIITFALSTPHAPHWTVLLGLFLTYVLLFLEARRYRDFDVWRCRVRVLEEMFLAVFFDRRLDTGDEWKQVLAHDLQNPRYKISWLEAVRRRLKRVYIWVILTFLVAWTGKIYLHPEQVNTVGEFFDRISGSLSYQLGVMFFFLIVGTVVLTSLYFLLAAPQREARGVTDTKQIDEKFATSEYIEKFDDSDDTSA